jgi:hypothetical protein
MVPASAHSFGVARRTCARPQRSSARQVLTGAAVSNAPIISGQRAVPSHSAHSPHYRKTSSGVTLISCERCWLDEIRSHVCRPTCEPKVAFNPATSCQVSDLAAFPGKRKGPSETPKDPIFSPGALDLPNTPTFPNRGGLGRRPASGRVGCQQSL